MSKANQTKGNARFDEIINSPKFQEYYKEQHRALVVSAMLQDAMEKKHLTQTAVANTMGISQADVSKILSGKKKNFTVETLLRFCDAIGSRVTIM